jgi:hypothetical protein
MQTSSRPFSVFSSAFKVVRTCFVSAVWLLLLCAASIGNTQTQSGTIRVTPDLGLPGEERTITFSGIWPNGCIPVADGVTAEPIGNPSIIRLRVNIVQTLAPCTQATTPYELIYKYTPSALALAIVAETNDRRVLAYGRLAIGDLPLPLPNVSGAWIDWTRVASILNLTQNISNFSIVGNWGTFNNSGAPTWYLIHSSRLVAPNTYEASLSEYIASPDPAVSCLTGQPPTFCPGFIITGERSVGIVRITARTRDIIELDARTPGPDNSFATGRPFLVNSFSRYNF